MNRRLFFLNQHGWFEVKLTGKMLQVSHDELIRRAYTRMKKRNYRNYMVTENPGRIDLQVANSSAQKAQTHGLCIELEHECF